MPYLELMTRINRNEARKKMQFAPRRSSSNTWKVADGGTFPLSKTSLEQNSHKFCRKDPEVSAVILRNSDQRYVILTVVTVELDAHWQFLAPFFLPMQGSDQGNCLGYGADVRMDSPEPISPSPAILFLLDVQKAQTSHHLPDHMCCAKSFTASSSYASNGFLQSQNRGSVNKRTEAATVPNSCSLHNCNTSNDSSGSGHDGSVGTGSADLVRDASKVDKPVKRSSRKKLKKGRQQKKTSSSCNSDIAVVSEQGIHGISSLYTCSNSGSTLRDGCSLENNWPENATPFSMSPQEIRVEKINNEESNNDSVSLSATTSKATFCGNDVEFLEKAASLPHNSAGDDFRSKQLSVDERPLIVTTSTIQTTNIALSDFGGEVLDVNLKQCSFHDEITSIFPSDEYSCPVLDSFSDGWNSDEGTTTSDDVNSQPPIRKENGILPLDSGVILDCSNCHTSFHDVTSGKGHSTCGTSYDSNNGTANSDNHWSKVVADTNNNSDRTRCGSQGCSSRNSFSVISGKKGRQGRKSSASSGVDAHGRAGNKSNHSVWQKVQKTDVDKCFFEPKVTDPVYSQFSNSKEGSLFERHNTFVSLIENVHEKSTRSACLDEISAQTDVLKMKATTDADASSLKSKYDRLRNKVPEKLKRVLRSESKHENSHNSRKGTHIGKATSVKPTKMNVPQKEEFDISLPINNYKSFGAGSRSSSFPTDSSICSSEQLQYSQGHSEKTRPLGSVIAIESDMNALASQNQTNTLSAVLDSLLQLEAESDCSSKFCKDKLGDCLQMCNENGFPELETYVSQVENRKSEHDYGSILQKRIPVGRKDVEALANLSFSHLDDQFSDLKITEEEQLSSGTHCHVSFTSTGVTCICPSSGSVNYTLSEDEVTSELKYHAAGMPKERSSMHIASGYQPIHKSNEQVISVNENNLSKISQAVNDAYRMQIESEGVQLTMGSPLAEFERFLHYASPVLELTYSVPHCNACSGDHMVGDSLCRHQIPNVSLGSLWQWYEKPGSYGLEVKTEDYHNSKRFGSDHFQFCAYFVPFLSAVQLFGNSSSSMCASNAMPNAESTKTYDVDATSEYSSHFNLQRVFSILLPRPHREKETELSVPVNLLSTSDSLAASGQDKMCKRSVTSACVSDSELLFEYFESEQPQQRRPLFEKIHELVKGNATSNSQIFGDPLKLECLHLHDLHPSSWYSVAWYPIYRIPDGNFRAAFLTYHSLGHFIHRSGLSDSPGGGASIVSPVVGLQSYNAQGECWFQPRNSMATQGKGSFCFNSSEVFKERLRTLEQTAYMMSRASFCKGDHKFVNRQPDYEFFISRRR